MSGSVAARAASAPSSPTAALRCIALPITYSVHGAVWRGAQSASAVDVSATGVPADAVACSAHSTYVPLALLNDAVVSMEGNVWLTARGAGLAVSAVVGAKALLAGETAGGRRVTVRLSDGVVWTLSGRDRCAWCGPLRGHTVGLLGVPGVTPRIYLLGSRSGQMTIYTSARRG